MDFNIRAISLAESVPFDACTPVSQLLGKEIQFRSGLAITITLPSEPGAFSRLRDPERVLCALEAWTRVYQYPEGGANIIHVLAPAEGASTDAEILLYRVDFLQHARIKPGPRSPVEVLDSAVMTYDQCATWLANLSHNQGLAHRHTKGTILQRPRVLRAPMLRIAWVGAEKIGGESLPARLRALGSVMGAEITHVGSQTFAHVKARLASISSLDAVVLCTGTATYITRDVAPKDLPPEALHHCPSTCLAEIESELSTIIETTRVLVAEARTRDGVDETDELLRLMLRGMISHSKIGQFCHCDRDEVLTAVRARRLNVPAAGELLDSHSEVHQDTKSSDKFFLWKDHNDGRQYFLNPKKVEDVRSYIASARG
jgi:hypothetical protein